MTAIISVQPQYTAPSGYAPSETPTVQVKASNGTVLCTISTAPVAATSNYAAPPPAGSTCEGLPPDGDFTLSVSTLNPFSIYPELDVTSKISCYDGANYNSSVLSSVTGQSDFNVKLVPAILSWCVHTGSCGGGAWWCCVIWLLASTYHCLM